MAIGPRLDLRQSQSLVMTPQLRQAIKLLQFSNLEVAAFVEEELERNPCWNATTVAEGPALERPALDQLPVGTAGRTWRWRSRPTQLARREAASPLDADHAETYDPGSAGDGVRPVGQSAAAISSERPHVERLRAARGAATARASGRAAPPAPSRSTRTG